jgi:Protein of unknown function (DUF3306)
MADNPDDSGFLSRWSRRKAQVRQGARPAEPAAVVPPVAVHGTALPATAPTAVPTTTAPAVAAGLPAVPSPAAQVAAPADATSPDRPAAEAPLPSMDDVAKLTAESDYSVFTSPRVDPQVRNAALKKLFHADPHFNVMDGLDVYIDDYSKADPLPLSSLRLMQQARVLGLLDDELVDQDKPLPDMPTETAAEGHTAGPDEDTDLQLQPHDAAGPPGAGPGTGSDTTHHTSRTTTSDPASDSPRPGQPGDA